MNKSRRAAKLSPKKLRRLIIVIVLIIAAITGGVLYLRSKVAKEYGNKNSQEVSSATVTAGNISTSVYGSGTLSDDDVEQMTVPEGVTLKKIYVSRGDSVNEGDMLAAVDTGSVLAAMSELSDEIEELDEDINDASSESISSSISSSVSGRVKKIYAEAGDNVATVMYEHGALMLVSLDGCMKAEIETDALSVDDEVTLTGSDGVAYTGTVNNIEGKSAVIYVTDNGPVLEDTVTVTAADGSTLGTATLEINSPLKVTGFAGTVYNVNVKENGSVSSGTKLLSLSDTAYTANYEALLEERSDKEDELQELVKIYKEGGIVSTVTGTVKTVSAEVGEVDDEDEQQYISVCPDKTMSISLSIDESDILSVSVGQSAAVSIDSISDSVFEGTVTEIDKSGTSSDGVTLYTATVSIEKTSGMLSGMSASATITIDGVDNALLIPVDALNKTADGYYVYTTYDEINGTLGGMTQVSVGISNTNYTEITSGLKEGETVYYFEEEDSGFGGFGGGMPSGDFSGFGGGNMPSGDFSGGGNMPSGDFGGGGMPSGGGNMPSGGPQGNRG